ncbi:MAG: hypothetical protein WEA82_10680 [Idiomarina sp.]
MDAFYSLPLTGPAHQQLADKALPIVASNQMQTTSVANWHEPAVRVLHDFASKPPLQLLRQTSLAAAEAQLLQSGEFEAVVTSSEGGLVGVLALQHIHSRKTLDLAQQQHLRWEQLRVENAMIPVNQLPGVSCSQVQQARIGDVVATLQQLGNHYLLVHTKDAVRGIISALTIQRLTQESVPLQPPLFPGAEAVVDKSTSPASRCCGGRD